MGQADWIDRGNAAPVLCQLGYERTSEISKWYNTYNTIFQVAPTEFSAPVKSHDRVFPDRVCIDRVYLHPLHSVDNIQREKVSHLISQFYLD